MDIVWAVVKYGALVFVAAGLGACAVGLITSVMVLLRPHPGDSRSAAWRGLLWYGVVPTVVLSSYWFGWRMLRAIGADVWSLTMGAGLVAVSWCVVVALLRRRCARSHLRISVLANHAAGVGPHARRS